jgi:addiction module HigA family antidote
MKKKTKLAPVTPGEVLREEFLIPLGLRANRLALELRVPATRMVDIINGRRGIAPDTAIRLGRFFNTSPKFWMNLQSRYELEIWEDRVRPEVDRDVRPISATAAAHKPR